VITLTNQFSFERFSVYRDDVNPLQFYYMPSGPRVALDQDGKPLFSLIMYRRDLSAVPEADRATKLGGGILSLSVELSADPDELDRLTSYLQGDAVVKSLTRGDTKPQLILGLIPVQSGTVQIQILAEDGSKPGDFVGTLVGAGSVSMTGTELASCMAKLTMDGAALIWTAMEKDLKVIRVAYTLNFNYRVMGLVVDAWCNAEKAYHALQSQWATMNEQASFYDSKHWHTYDHSKSNSLISAIGSTTTSGEFSGVTVTPSVGPDQLKPEYLQQVEQNAEAQITQFIADTFTAYKPVEATAPDKDPDISSELPTEAGKKYGSDSISNFTLKTWDESMSATYHYHLEQQSVVPFTVAPQDNMSNLLHGQNVNAFRTQISLDPAFYKFLDVMVVCTADFDNDPVSLVKAHLSYSASGPQGPINQINDFLFEKGGTPQQRFSTYIADVNKQTYNYEYEVYYKGSADKYSVSGQSNETILVLDADAVGILKVDVQMGIVDWDQIRQVIVKLSYDGGAQSTEVNLDAQHQSYRWIQVIGKPVTEPYTWSATLVDKGGQRLEIPPTQQRGALVIDQPISEQLAVTLIGVGTFGAQGLIQEIGVAVRYTDADNNYHQNATFQFLKEGDVKEWKIPLVNSALRSYEYQVTVIYTGGVTRVDAWRPSDATILPVGDPFGYKVTVLPYLLKNTQWMFGTLKLWFDDPQTSIHAENSLQIVDYTSPLSWRFRLGAPERHNYHYQLSLFQADNTSYVSQDTQASDEVLVLRPPPSSAPQPGH
jgi:hypothetical protein